MKRAIAAIAALCAAGCDGTEREPNSPQMPMPMSMPILALAHADEATDRSIAFRGELTQGELYR